MIAETSPTDVTAWLVGTPVTVLAFGIVAFVRGWVVPGTTHTRVLAKNDEQAAEIRRLHVVFEDKVIPTLVRSTDLMARIAEQERA